MMDLFGCMCDAIVCETSEMWLCGVYWLGFLCYWGGVSFILFRVLWFGLISCDFMWFGFCFCDACLCFVQLCACVVCMCVCVYVCMHVMSDL